MFKICNFKESYVLPTWSTYTDIDCKKCKQITGSRALRNEKGIKCNTCTSNMTQQWKHYTRGW
jgi:hypothetical protein